MDREIISNIDKLNSILRENPNLIDRSGFDVLESFDFDKQTIIVFSLTGQKRQLAFRIVKATDTTSGMIKFSEYVNCQRLQRLQIGAPAVFYVDCEHKEAITEWFAGEAIADFSSDKITKEMPTQKDIEGIQDAFVSLHSNLSESFSYSEEEPVIDRSYVDIFDKADKQELLQFLLTGYRKVFPNLAEADGNAALTGLLPEIRGIAGRGLEFLEKQREAVESVPVFSLLHGDMTPENIIRTSDGIRLTDFEYMHYGDPAAELAFFFEEGTQLGFIDNEAKEKFVSSYKRKMYARTGIDDRTLSARIGVYQVYVMFKFLGLICNGLTAEGKEKINFGLLEDILTRSRNLAESL